MAEAATEAGSISVALLQQLWQAVRCSYWQRVPSHPTRTFSPPSCQKLCADDGEDIALVRLPGRQVFALTARCPHADGPLDQGDIEEIGNRTTLVCPDHLYEFDVATGASSTGLQAQVFAVRCVDDAIFVNTPSRLALKYSAWLPPISKTGAAQTVEAAENQLLRHVQDILQTRTVTGKIAKVQSFLEMLKEADICESFQETKTYAISPVTRGRLKDIRRKGVAVRQLTLTAMELMQFVDGVLVAMVMLPAASGKAPGLEKSVGWWSSSLRDLLEWLRELHRMVEVSPANLDDLAVPPVPLQEAAVEQDNVFSHFLSTLAVRFMVSLARELETLAGRVSLLEEEQTEARALIDRVQTGLQQLLQGALTQFSSTLELAGMAQNAACVLKTALSEYNRDYVELPFSADDSDLKDCTQWYKELLKLTEECTS